MKVWKTVVLIFVLCAMLMTACGNQEPEKTPVEVDAVDLFRALRQQVQFDTPIADTGESGANFFPDLPEYALVTMYSGSGYYADELTWITVATEADVEQALDSVQTHLKQVHEQFLSYIPDEVDKIDNAQIWNQGVHIIVCVSNDYKNAKAIMADPAAAIAKLTDATEPVETDALTEPTVESTEPPTEEPTEAPTELPTEEKTTEPPEETKAITGTTGGIKCTGVREDGYPLLTSTSGSYHSYSAACIVDNMAFEFCYPSGSSVSRYAELVSSVAQALEGETAVYDLIIPTAIGVVFPDDVVDQLSSYVPQGEKIEEIFGQMDESVIQVNCFDNLMKHRDEYLYFRTDWHWNGPGAYYAYETFCQVKGITPYTMQEREISEFEGYLGALYQNTCDKDQALADTPDTVIACHPYSPNAYMYFTDSKGNRYSWNIITDVSNRSADAKYYTYAAADQPLAEFYNPDVTDGSVAIVVKESYGNVLMSYLVDHYSTIYEIDYRYWTGDLVEFAREKGADDIIFANNLTAIGSDYLVGLLDKIIP